jgi:hypothetical protein
MSRIRHQSGQEKPIPFNGFSPNDLKVKLLYPESHLYLLFGLFHFTDWLDMILVIASRSLDPRKMKKVSRIKNNVETEGNSQVKNRRSPRVAC